MSKNELSAKHMGELIDAHRCLRCGNEDENAGKGGWSACFTVCEKCWSETVAAPPTTSP